MIGALGQHRHRKPSWSRRGPNLIAVAPIAPRILHVVKKNKDIAKINDIEIPPPWNVVRLKNRDTTVS